MSESRIAPEHASPGRPLIHLSELLRAPVVARSGETVGRVEDVIVRLRGADTYPLVTGIVAGVGGRQVFVGSRSIHQYAPGRVVLAKNRSTCAGSSAATARCCCAPTCSGTGSSTSAARAWSAPATSGFPHRRRLGAGRGGHPPAAPPAVRPARPPGAATSGAGLAGVRAADRPRPQCGAARPVRPDPPAQARPDRRPARRRLQSGGDRDPRPGARRP